VRGGEGEREVLLAVELVVNRGQFFVCLLQHLLLVQRQRAVWGVSPYC
jgi:hypothetical protein